MRDRHAGRKPNHYFVFVDAPCSRMEEDVSRFTYGSDPSVPNFNSVDMAAVVAPIHF